MRILIVSDFYFPFINGVARQTEGLARALSASGHLVRILAPGDDSTDELDQHTGITVSRVRGAPSILSKDLRICASIFGPTSRIEEVVVNWHPDVIHVQTNLLLAWISKRIATKHRVPLLFSHHNFLYCSTGHWWRSLDLIYQKYLTRLFGHYSVTVPSQAAAQHFRDEYSDNREYIHLPNGNHENWFDGRHRSRNDAKKELALGKRNVLVYVGRLSAEKRLLDAIDGVHLIDDDNLRLILVGTGAQERNLRARASQWRGEDRVLFAGKLQCHELLVYYEAADAFLCPSPVESHSLAQLEALSCGLPVLGVSEGGTSATITDGVNGMLVPPRNPAALAKTIEKYFALPATVRKDMEQEAMRSAKSVGFSLLIDRYVGLYSKLIGGERMKSFDNRPSTEKFVAGPPQRIE